MSVGNLYEYEIDVKPLVPPMTLYSFVARIVEVIRVDPSGKRERINPLVGESGGKDADEAITRAREKMEKWIADQGSK